MLRVNNCLQLFEREITKCQTEFGSRLAQEEEFLTHEQYFKKDYIYICFIDYLNVFDRVY